MEIDSKTDIIIIVFGLIFYIGLFIYAIKESKQKK